MQGFDNGITSLARTSLARTVKRAAAVLALAGSLTLAGCGGFDGVELQGGVFDALGLSGSDSKKLADVKVEARPGLVLPPSTDKLPDPVTGSLTPAPNADGWPTDAADRKEQSRAELQKRQDAFCERAISDQRVRKESGPVMGPAGICNPGLLSTLTKNL